MSSRSVEKQSPCKVNLLLNILGKRPDGFHELETLMNPVALYDTLSFKHEGTGLGLTCSEPALPVDSTNLVYRAAAQFCQAAGIKDGIRIHLEKRIPMAAGLGGGSGNAAITLLGLNELFDGPLPPGELHRIAASLGSDIPFFLQHGPALATGRGEFIEPLGTFAALRGTAFLLIHPGFGVATAWAYKHLADFPEALNGRPGRARRLSELLAQGGPDALRGAAPEFYNSLEAPVLKKHPLLALFQEFLRENGALVAMMSGSGSATFAIVKGPDEGNALLEKVRARFGANNWLAVTPASA